MNELQEKIISTKYPEFTLEKRNVSYDKNHIEYIWHYENEEMNIGTNRWEFKDILAVCDMYHLVYVENA